MAKSLGKNLLGLFVQFEDQEKSSPSASASAPGQGGGQAGSPSTASGGKQDDAVAKVLSDALEKANLEGYDYFEFAKTIDQLKPSQPSEQGLFTTAFTLGKVMGATKDKLLQTANTYLDVLKKKADEFEAVFQAKLVESVTNRENDIKEMDTEIKNKAAQIRKLTEDINTMASDKANIANEISENRIKIEATRNNFNATLQLFTGRISGDIDKIGRYIQ